ncbi:hypothetical protein FRC14_004884 [Serendipita sp. 396]|nr:hypothetical protein FRC14_004884 [Serendipita sp. 396]KAG8866397.1 hypothetical protein FRC20_008648 [Serendipita sp. 405]
MVYPFICCVLQDVLAVHQEIKDRYDIDLSPRMLLGDRYRSDQPQSKSGTYETLSKRWDTHAERAGKPLFAQVWAECIQDGRCLGGLLPTEYDLRFVAGTSPLGIHMAKANRISSLMRERGVALDVQITDGSFSSI